MWLPPYVCVARAATSLWCDPRRVTTPSTISARLQVERLEEALRAAKDSCSNVQREAGDAAGTAEAEILRYT